MITSAPRLFAVPTSVTPNGATMTPCLTEQSAVSKWTQITTEELRKVVRKMEKLYFVLSLVLLAIITVINVESNWRFITVELIVGMGVMLPDVISSLIKDIRWLWDDSRQSKK